MARRSSLHRVGDGLPAPEALALRQKTVAGEDTGSYADLFQTNLDVETVSRKNCENLIGSVEVPVGVAGPLRLTGDVLDEEVIVPLATTEGALVASVSRGCKALSQSGGAQVMVERKGMTRSPVFECPSGAEAKKFLAWFEEHIDKVREIAEQTSTHLTLLSHNAWIRGRYVYVRFSFNTDEAMGMNMVTIALQEALRGYLKTRNTAGIRLVSLSSNVCTDKKDSALNALLGRGYWVQAEAFLSSETVEQVFHTDFDTLLQVHVQKNLIGSNIAGSISQNAHVANVLSAVYIATGQDPAHVVDGSQAFLSLERVNDRLYTALTLPSVNVGAVGGGTALAAQSQARALMRSGKNISAQQLAGVIGAAALAGELSLMAALAEHKLAYAHQKLGRGK